MHGEGVARPEPRPLPLGTKRSCCFHGFLININLLCDLANPLLAKTDKRTPTLTNSYVMFTTVKEWERRDKTRASTPQTSTQPEERSTYRLRRPDASCTKHPEKANLQEVASWSPEAELGLRVFCWDRQF